MAFGDENEVGSRGAAAPRNDSVRQAEDPRTVFVIHGRDLDVRNAIFDFLRALGLKPQEWEHLVRATGKGAPSLTEVVTRAVREAQAVVALLTPDDRVQLHPELREASDTTAELSTGCQARPNVFLELGMALAALPDHTIILEAGDMRRTADLAGLNYVTVSASVDWRNKVAQRLENAGCPVDRAGGDWQHPHRFADLAAHRRR
ncbi:TIR domain-containing protein [Actinoplanes lobatus]|uniref:Putative nucleotide-binding protein n=1 Tax=Actinoplanes lobatus TaxID=113568 RepID=A0A7W7HH65_9ACTN|nr:nucleotide-binding protein [Actinoplanes lobatus]MBB4750473.1 putative nucleotide-binding protein [Actinoplanes lobatus]